MSVFIRSVAIANLGLLSIGLAFGWSSSSIPKLISGSEGVKASPQEIPWIVSLSMVGSTLGSLFAACILNRIGRRNVLLLSSAPHVIGWAMIGFATTIEMLLFGRLIIGIGTGCIVSTAALYFCEIAPAKHRGATAASSLFTMKLGILLAYVMGIFMTVRTQSFVSMVFPLIFGLLFTTAPETPYYLTLRGRHEQAEKNLIKLRGTQDVAEELKTINNMIDVDLRTNTSVFDLFLVKSNRKAFIILFFLETMQHFTGSSAVSAYTETIFDAAHSELSGKYLAVVVGLVQLGATCFTVFLVDRGGRRVLLMFSIFGCAVCTFIVAIYFYFQETGRDVSPISWTAASGVIFFSVAYGVGLSSIPNMMMGELFPASVRPKAAGFFGIYGNICTFFVVTFFDILGREAGLYTPFFIFCASDVLGLVHVTFFVPETKRKTLQEVQDMMMGKAEDPKADDRKCKVLRMT